MAIWDQFIAEKPVAMTERDTKTTLLTCITLAWKIVVSGSCVQGGFGTKRFTVATVLQRDHLEVTPSELGQLEWCVFNRINW